MIDETTEQQQPPAKADSPAAAAIPVQVAPDAQADFDQIWTAVFAENRPRAGQVRRVLFTAPGRKEGVSTLLAGAAVTGAALRANLRIALLDLNTRYPQLAELLGAADRPGLADVVAGDASLDAVGQAVGTANLTFYPSGLVKGGATQLLSSPRLDQVLAELAQRHDYLMCDCAAANLFPDAQILAPMFDGAVLIAEAGATRRESLAEAKKRIELGQGKLLGVILNKRRYPVPRFLYRRS